MNDLYIFGGMFIAIYLFTRWLESKLPDTCNCDDAAQGRACKSCDWPHLPRKEDY